MGPWRQEGRVTGSHLEKVKAVGTGVGTGAGTDELGTIDSLPPAELHLRRSQKVLNNSSKEESCVQTPETMGEEVVSKP